MSFACYESGNFARYGLTPAVGRFALGCSTVDLVHVNQGGKVLLRSEDQTVALGRSANHLYQIVILWWEIEAPVKLMPR